MLRGSPWSIGRMFAQQPGGLWLESRLGQIVIQKPLNFLRESPSSLTDLVLTDLVLADLVFKNHEIVPTSLYLQMRFRL